MFENFNAKSITDDGNLQEKNVMRKYKSDFREKNGCGYLFIVTDGEKGKLFFDNFSEDLIFFDAYVDVEGEQYYATKGQKCSFVMKNSTKFGLQIDSTCFTYTKKAGCRIKSILVHAESATMVFLFFFDAERNLFPIIMFETSKKYCDIPEMLENKFVSSEMNNISNIYHLILQAGKKCDGREVCISGSESRLPNDRRIFTE